MEAAALHAAAVAAGVAGGIAFALIWRRIAPMSLHGAFWTTMAGVTRGMLAAEETAEFLRLYRRLGVSLFGYVGRNLGGLLLGCLPVVALAFALSPLLFGPWDARAGTATVHPPGAAALERRPEGGFLLTIADTSEAIPLQGEPLRAAVCWTALRCLLLRSLDFSVIALDAPPAGAAGAVIVRPDGASWNPLFPYLNDLEFVFFLASFAGVAGGFMIRRRRP